MSRQALGKGLRALIPGGEPTAGEIRAIPVDKIDPNPYQPRREVDGEELDELVQSILAHGVVQPVVVRPRGERYELLVGERRWRAARKAGLATVPAVVRAADPVKMLELALIENLQRSDLNPLEEAQAYHRLMQEFGLSQEAVAAAVGKKRPTVANLLRLLELPEEVQALVAAGRISTGHAKALLGLGPAEQKVLCEEIVREELSVRAAERRARQLARGPGRVARKKALDPELRLFERRASEALGRRVRIRPGARRGVVEIEFHSREDLDRLLGHLVREEGP